MMHAVLRRSFPMPRTTWLALAAIALVLTIGVRPSDTYAQCTPNSGPCLVVHQGSGCNDADCCQSVCSQDPSCCSANWDADCVLAANQNCVGLCGATASLSCLKPHDTPACDDETCCQLVCAIDSFCCDVRWDFQCSFSASINCDLGGGPGVCGDPAAGSCYKAHGTPACDDAPCCNAVCAVSPSCCDLVWDVLCASIANSVCLGSCTPTCPPGSIVEMEACDQNLNDPCYFPSATPVLQTLPCNGSACGKIHVVGSKQGLVHDVDVWKLNLVDDNGDGVVSVQLSFASGFDGFAALVPASGCPSLSTALTHIDSGQCVEATSAAVCVPPGAYRVVIASGLWPIFGNTIIECGTNDGYYVRAFCSDLGCSVPCAPGSGACFEPHKSPGCEDVSCCQETCVQDPSCCEFSWDGACAEMAIALCAEPPANDQCATAQVIDDGTTTFVTYGATNSLPAAPSGCSAGIKDVWFRYTPSRSGMATVTTCGNQNTFDSAIAVYGGTCGSLLLLGCNDTSPDTVCFPTNAARVTWSATCGTTYFIRVGGGWGISGVTLTPGSGQICPVTCTGDLNADGSVGPQDLAILLGAWGGSGPADLDGNGTVNAADLAILLGAWGSC